MAWQDWNGRAAWYSVKLTPGYPLLYGALGIGLLAAGLQSTSQLEHIYGRTMATTLRASFRNLAVLGGSRTDPQTARDMSESLGKHEVEHPKFSVSRSVDHRNTSDNMDRATEDVVTAVQIQALPVLEGYVAMAGELPVARVKMPYRWFQEQAALFLEA